MTRSVILKLAAGGHRRQRACAIQDLLVQRIIPQRIPRHVIHVLTRGQNLIAQLLHVIELIAEQLKSASIRIG
jgi:hypothetical protein